jgi:cation diffusion facilitator family transporter
VADEESTGTVLVALAANLAIAVAKIAAGLIGGSSAMLAEGAHSVADTTNQVFLLTSLRLSRKAPDDTHPFGYGKERFFWSLLAAVGIFVSGAVFSIFEGVHGLLSGESEVGGYLLSYGVLLISFLAEGTSWLKAVRQLRAEARETGRSMIEHVRLSSDPTVKTVFSEDTAALVGLVLAALGLGLHQLTGQAFWDAGAAIAIGVLLAVVAYLLGRDTKEMLIGEAAPAAVRDGIRAELADHAEVDRVLDVRTMLLGPEALLGRRPAGHGRRARRGRGGGLHRRDLRRPAGKVPAGARGLPGRHLRRRASGRRDQPGGEQHEQQQPEADAVGDEHQKVCRATNRSSQATEK